MFNNPQELCDELNKENHEIVVGYAMHLTFKDLDAYEKIDEECCNRFKTQSESIRFYDSLLNQAIDEVTTYADISAENLYREDSRKLALKLFKEDVKKISDKIINKLGDGKRGKIHKFGDMVWHVFVHALAIIASAIMIYWTAVALEFALDYTEHTPERLKKISNKYLGPITKIFEEEKNIKCWELITIKGVKINYNTCTMESKLFKVPTE